MTVEEQKEAALSIYATFNGKIYFLTPLGDLFNEIAKDFDSGKQTGKTNVFKFDIEDNSNKKTVTGDYRVIFWHRNSNTLKDIVTLKDVEVVRNNVDVQINVETQYQHYFQELISKNTTAL